MPLALPSAKVQTNGWDKKKIMKQRARGEMPPIKKMEHKESWVEIHSKFDKNHGIFLLKT